MQYEAIPISKCRKQRRIEIPERNEIYDIELLIIFEAEVRLSQEPSNAMFNFYGEIILSSVMLTLWGTSSTAPLI